MTPLTFLLVALRAPFRPTAREGFLMPPMQSAFSCSFCCRFAVFFGIPAFQGTSGWGVSRARFLGGSVASDGNRASLCSVALGSFWQRGAGGCRGSGAERPIASAHASSAAEVPHEEGFFPGTGNL